MTPALATTMSPRAVQLLGAMRRNLELLVELEKTDPAGVVVIVGALISHLRSWKPLAAVSVPAMIDPAVVPAPVEPAEMTEGGISRALENGSRYEIYRMPRENDEVVELYLHEITGSIDSRGVFTPEGSHDASGVFTPEAAKAFIADFTGVLDAIGAR